MLKNYIYTNKKHSVYGIMSSFFGLLATITYIICLYRSYLSRGVDVERYSVSAFLATLFMIVGTILFIISLLEYDKFWFFRIVGIVLNVIALMCLSMILYAGAILN